jgi:hypothetical protein
VSESLSGERHCVHHPAQPAIAICTDCGGDICAPCHGMDIRGFCVCASCREKYGPVGTAWENPQTRWSVAGFGRTVVEALSSPRTFYARLNPRASATPAMVFGVICASIGLFFATLWQMLFGNNFDELLLTYSEQLAVSTDTTRLYLFASVPMVALFIYSMHVLLLYAALKLFGAQTNLHLTARIVGYAMAAYVLLVFPPLGTFSLGHFLMIVWLFNLEIGAVRWFFNLGFWKSMGVVMIPFIVMLMTTG